MYFTSTKDIRLHLIYLQNIGIILKRYKIPNKGEKLDIYDIPINKNFIKDFYKSSFEMGKELFETYLDTYVFPTQSTLPNKIIIGSPIELIIKP